MNLSDNEARAPNDILAQQFLQLEKQLFVAELASLEHRTSCCEYWLDWARLQGDATSFAKLDRLLHALRIHRQRCRDILVSFLRSKVLRSRRYFATIREIVLSFCSFVTLKVPFQVTDDSLQKASDNPSDYPPNSSLNSPLNSPPDDQLNNPLDFAAIAHLWNSPPAVDKITPANRLGEQLGVDFKTYTANVASFGSNPWSSSPMTVVGEDLQPMFPPPTNDSQFAQFPWPSQFSVGPEDNVASSLSQ